MWRLLALSDAETGLVVNNTEDRILMPYRIRQSNFDILFVGSSRVKSLLTSRAELQDSKLTASLFGQSRVFVAGYSGVNIYVLKRTIEHALALKELEEVYLLIDFVAMNDGRPNGAGWKDDRYKGGRFEETGFGLIANFMSVNMLGDSMESLQRMWGNRAVEDEVSPMLSPSDDPAARCARISRRWSGAIAEFFRSDLYGCHTIGETTIGHVESILQQMSAKGVRATIMTPVLHPAMMEMIWRTGNWKNYEAFLGLLTEISDRFSVPVWTFSPYADIVSGDIFKVDYLSSPGFHDAANFYDPAHVNSVVGQEMLSQVRGVSSAAADADTGFAFRLTPSSLEPVLAGFRDGHRQCRQNNTAIMSLVPAVRGNEHDRCGKDYGYPAFDG